MNSCVIMWHVTWDNDAHLVNLLWRLAANGESGGYVENSKAKSLPVAFCFRSSWFC